MCKPFKEYEDSNFKPLARSSKSRSNYIIDFTEGREKWKPGEKPLKHAREANYNKSTRMSSKSENEHGTRWSPMTHPAI